MQVRAEANLIWLCREQPTINRINPPELNIRIYSIRLNTDVRQLLTYSPKGYTSVTVGDTPTACARQTMSTRSGAILEQITDIIANKEAGLRN